MDNLGMIDLLNKLHSLDNLEGLDFFYEILKIEDIFLQENKIIQKTLKSLKDLPEYDNKRDMILKKHCEKDEKGNPISRGPNSFAIAHSKYDIVEKEISEIDEKHKDSLAQRKNLLGLESKAKFKKIKISLVPKNISGAQLRLIKDLVE